MWLITRTLTKHFHSGSIWSLNRTLITTSTFDICDEEIWHPNTFSGLWEKGAVTLWSSADDCSKQELQNSGSGRGRLSFTPLYDYKAINVSAERQTCDHDGYWGRNRQKTNTWWIFKLRKLVSCCLFITGWRRIMSRHLVVKGWRHIMSCHFFVGEWRHIIRDMKETQIPK